MALPEMVTIEILKNNAWEVIYSEIDRKGGLFDDAQKTVSEAIATGEFTSATIRAARSPFGMSRITAAQKKEFYGEGESDEEN